MNLLKFCFNFIKQQLKILYMYDGCFKFYFLILKKKLKNIQIYMKL